MNIELTEEQCELIEQFWNIRSQMGKLGEEMRVIEEPTIGQKSKLNGLTGEAENIAWELSCLLSDSLYGD